MKSGVLRLDAVQVFDKNWMTCRNVANAADCVLKLKGMGMLVANITFINCFFQYVVTLS